MVNPRALADTSTVFLSGNDSAAEDAARETARGPEMYLPLWLRLYGATKSGTFNIKIVSAKA